MFANPKEVKKQILTNKYHQLMAEGYSAEIDYKVAQRIGDADSLDRIQGAIDSIIDGIEVIHEELNLLEEVITKEEDRV